MRALALVLAVAVALGTACRAAAVEPPVNDGTSWPTLHGDVRRAGFYPELPARNLKLAWCKQLWRELSGPRAEVIVAEGLAFLGSYAGRLRAWDLASGEERWAANVPGPILHSPAYAAGSLYVASSGGVIAAYRATSGQPQWQVAVPGGFATSPLVWQGRVFCGARSGLFYAFDAASGRELWRITAGGPILTTASVLDDGERIVFASEDLRVTCVKADDSQVLWRSRKLPGLSLRDYAPTVVGGLVLVATNPVRDFHSTLDTQQALLVGWTGFTGGDARYIAGTPADAAREQEHIVEFLRANPAEQCFFALRQSDGIEPWIAPILYQGGLHNPPTPPCYDPRSGDVFVFYRSAYSVWDGGGEVRPYTAVGRLNLTTGRITAVEHRHASKEPGRPPGRRDMPWNSFATIGDETQALACSPRFLLSCHQGSIGSLDLASGLTASLYGQRDSYLGLYGPASFGWENQGGYEKAAAAGLPYGLVNEWHGPARSIASVVGERVLYHTGSAVFCLTGARP